MQKIVVIGGGAAGFFAAINIAEMNPNFSVCLLEKSNMLLSKVKVSGGGRCNVTHACFDPRELVEHYPRGQKELRGPFNHFSTGDTISWFSERGIELKIEGDGRMFPITDSSQTIIDCFLAEAKRLGIEIKLKHEVISINKSEQFHIQLKEQAELKADRLVVAIGGNSKVKHYDFLKKLSHRIIDPLPSLFTFNLPQHLSNQLMGLSLMATVKLPFGNYEEYGPVLFTHWGMSGPAILKLSARAAVELHRKSYQLDYKVSWMDEAAAFISKERRLSAGRKLKNSKPEGIPSRLWDYFLNRAELSENKNWADLNKLEMEKLEQVLSADVYSANGKTTFKEEFVTCGGVTLKEINMKTMESKLIEGLYFCGEVINVDAVTGGFNFQAAWTSAYRVAEAISAVQTTSTTHH